MQLYTALRNSKVDNMSQDNARKHHNVSSSDIDGERLPCCVIVSLSDTLALAWLLVFEIKAYK